MSTLVCFDLDGTLLQYERAFDAVTRTALETHLDAVSDEMVDAYTERFLETFEALDPDPYHAGLRAAVAAADDSHATPGDAPIDAMVDTLRDEEYAATTVQSATRDCLTELAADEDTRLAVVTDGVGDWQRGKLDRHDLTEYFEEVVVSYDVGGHKTDGAPYAAVRERIDAEEYVMVGDSYESDVEAARAAGFVPIHYADEEADLFAVLRAML